MIYYGTSRQTQSVPEDAALRRALALASRLRFHPAYTERIRMVIFRQLARKLHGPRCHVTPEEKLWVEGRMAWLKAQFGPEPIRRTPLDPTSGLLPKKWDGSYTAGADLFNRLCGFMLVDPARLDLHFYSAGETGPAGVFYSRADEPKPRPKHVIALDEGDLQQPALLAATICHELAHVHLLGDRRLEPDEADGERLTDLLTVYFGAGILMANSVFQFSQWQSGTMQGWSWGKRGYLSEHLYGYALACFSWYRGDLEARWRKHLRQNVESYFSDAMHFLTTTSDTAIPFNGA